MKIEDRVAVVTGAGGGIGAALAKRLTDGGARVVLADLDHVRVDDVAGGVGEPICFRHASERQRAHDRVDAIAVAMLAADSSTAMLTCVYRTMLALRESAPLALRGGVTVGPVARVAWTEPDYLGSALNKAARLCGEAGPWQVRATLSASRRSVHFTLRTQSSPTE